MTGPKNSCVGGFDQQGPKHVKIEVYCLGRLPCKSDRDARCTFQTGEIKLC